MIYRVIYSLITKPFKYEPKLFQLYIKHSIYIGVYILLHLILFVTLILLIYTPSHIEIIINTLLYKNLLSISLCITALIPFIMCIIRIITEITQITFVHKCLSVFKNKICVCKYKLSPEEEAEAFPLAMSLTEFADKDNLTLKKFVTDIFVGLSYSFKQKKNEISGEEDETTNPKDIETYLVYEITNEEYQQTIEPNEQLFTNMLSKHKVTFIEYAPQTFAKIRNIDHIELNEMYQSFLPTNNIQSIQNIKSTNNSIFLSTSDNKFILKTITEHEYVTATYKFLPKYIKHIEQYKNSLLCPIYGVFKMITMNGQNECLILIMRNMIGPFSKDVICKFNLKGSSTRNKSSEIDLDQIEKNVLKDMEFNEAEKVLLLSPQKCEQVKDTIKNDATMLRDLGLMDYSLFVIKIKMNKSELYDSNRKDSKIEDEYSKDSTHVFDTKTGIKIDGCFRRFMYHSLKEGTVYVLVIIDYIQDYNPNKKEESTNPLLLSDKPTISYDEPDSYCERFIEYINKITNVRNLIKRKTFHTSVVMEESNEFSIERDLSHSNYIYNNI